MWPNVEAARFMDELMSLFDRHADLMRNNIVNHMVLDTSFLGLSFVLVFYMIKYFSSGCY